MKVSNLKGLVMENMDHMDEDSWKTIPSQKEARAWKKVVNRCMEMMHGFHGFVVGFTVIALLYSTIMREFVGQEKG